MVGKLPKDITFAAIENAIDVEQDAKDWISDSRNSVAVHDAQMEVIDLRQRGAIGLAYAPNSPVKMSSGSVVAMGSICAGY